ncbi:MAG: helix-turn-helix domain-containing protein [Sphingomonas sp.]
MTDPDSAEEATLFPKTAGDKLREARLAQNLTLDDVAARTRVPMRHLEAIELSNYAGLPSPTYAVGFAKAYARAVGLDEVAIGREVRQEVSNSPRAPEYEPYDVSDPSRLPPRGLATGLAVVAALIVAVVAIAYSTGWFHSLGGGSQPVAESAPPTPAPTTAPAPPPSPAPASGGQVTLTATDVVWTRIYDATGKTLFQGEMKPGDHFDVPADANKPMINVGRPDKLAITVNGSNVPPLGNGKVAIKDVEISAAALLARANPAATTPAADATTLATPAPAPATGKRRADREVPPAFRDTATPPPAADAPAANAATPTGGTGPGVNLPL